MSRCHPQPGRFRTGSLLAGVLSAVWLVGCSAQSTRPESGSSPAAAYTQLGMAYLEHDNLPRAQHALRHALTLAPHDAESLQALAMVYHRQGESQLADEYFQRALAVDTGHTRARNNYAAFLYDRGRLHDACAQLERAAQDIHYDNRAQVFANLGQCQRDIGDQDAAVVSLERAQAIDAHNPRSYFTLAEIEYSQGNYAHAWEQLQSFMRLSGFTPDSLQLARDIADARGDTENRRFFTEQLNALGDAL